MTLKEPGSLNQGAGVCVRLKSKIILLEINEKLFCQTTSHQSSFLLFSQTSLISFIYSHFCLHTHANTR